MKSLSSLVVAKEQVVTRTKNSMIIDKFMGQNLDSIISGNIQSQYRCQCFSGSLTHQLHDTHNLNTYILVLKKLNDFNRAVYNFSVIFDRQMRESETTV